MDRAFLLSNMQEKKVGRGEDSDPILFSNNDSLFIGVFDGMGGAGGTECISDFSHDGVDMTKAYVGSRIVKDAIEKSVRENPDILFASDLSDRLIDIIKTRYAEEQEKYPTKSKGVLRSALIKEYPTTLAISCITRQSDEYIVDSYWAGDSRNYVWTPNGLFQISIDDLKGNLDPLQNLYEDAPMSNCVQADAPFMINHKRIYLEKTRQFIILSATDGCFGYYPSPMDFEKALVNSLHKSNSLEEWNANLTKCFEFVSADDFSYSIGIIGFSNFKECKKAFKKSIPLIRSYCEHRRSFEGLVRSRSELDKKISIAESILKEEIESLWPQYRRSYLKYMESDE